MVEKVPEFSAESLCLRQGKVTSGRWCHMTLLDHVTPVGGWQLGCPGRCPYSVQASLGVFWWPPWSSSWTPVVFLVEYLGLFQAALVAHIVQMFTHRCSRCRPAMCSLYLVPRLLLVSPMYILLQLSLQLVYHQRPLVTIPWRRQRDSAKNSGTFSTIIWLCV